MEKIKETLGKTNDRAKIIKRSQFGMDVKSLDTLDLNVQGKTREKIKKDKKKKVFQEEKSHVCLGGSEFAWFQI